MQSLLLLQYLQNISGVDFLHGSSKDKTKGMRVGIGMISRGEVGLIVAGVGLGAGVLSSSVYSTIVIMVAATTIITPIWLKMDYRKELTKENKNSKTNE